MDNKSRVIPYYIVILFLLATAAQANFVVHGDVVAGGRAYDLGTEDDPWDDVILDEISLINWHYNIDGIISSRAKIYSEDGKLLIGPTGAVHQWPESFPATETKFLKGTTAGVMYWADPFDPVDGDITLQDTKKVRWLDAAGSSEYGFIRSVDGVGMGIESDGLVQITAVDDIRLRMTDGDVYSMSTSSLGTSGYPWEHLVLGDGSKVQWYYSGAEKGYISSTSDNMTVQSDGTLTLDPTGDVIILGGYEFKPDSTLSYLGTTAKPWGGVWSTNDYYGDSDTDMVWYDNFTDLNYMGEVGYNDGTGTFFYQVASSKHLELGTQFARSRWPAGRGSNGQFLQTDGAGTLAFATPSMTAVSGVLPLANGGTETALSAPARDTVIAWDVVAGAFEMVDTSEEPVLENTRIVLARDADTDEVGWVELGTGFAGTTTLAGAFTTVLGDDIDNSEIIDDTILEMDLNVDNTGAAGSVLMHLGQITEMHWATPAELAALLPNAGSTATAYSIFYSDSDAVVEELSGWDGEENKYLRVNSDGTALIWGGATGSPVDGSGTNNYFVLWNGTGSLDADHSLYWNDSGGPTGFLDSGGSFSTFIPEGAQIDDGYFAVRGDGSHPVDTTGGDIILYDDAVGNAYIAFVQEDDVYCDDLTEHAGIGYLWSAADDYLLIKAGGSGGTGDSIFLRPEGVSTGFEFSTEAYTSFQGQTGLAISSAYEYMFLNPDEDDNYTGFSHAHGGVVGISGALWLTDNKDTTYYAALYHNRADYGLGTRDALLIRGDVLPHSDNLYSLGSPSRRWKGLYVATPPIAGDEAIMIGDVGIGVAEGGDGNDIVLTAGNGEQVYIAVSDVGDGDDSALDVNDVAIRYDLLMYGGTDADISFLDDTTLNGQIFWDNTFGEYALSFLNYQNTPLFFSTNEDYDDFLIYETVSNVPTISTGGASDLTIAPSAGLNLQAAADLDIDAVGASTIDITGLLTVTPTGGMIIGSSLNTTGAIGWPSGSSTATNTHIAGNGDDHGYIDQDVTSGSSPTFDGANFSGIALNSLDNPDGDKTFNMTTRQLGFLWTNPSGDPVSFEASGAYTGSLLHIHQHTGNPSSAYLVELESTDTDIEHIKTTGPAATTETMCTYVSGDTEPRFELKSDGKHEWGAGGASVTDTTLYRSAADTLKTDDAFHFAGGESSGSITLADDKEIILGDGTVNIADAYKAFSVNWDTELAWDSGTGDIYGYYQKPTIKEGSDNLTNLHGVYVYNYGIGLTGFLQSNITNNYGGEFVTIFSPVSGGDIATNTAVYAQASGGTTNNYSFRSPVGTMQNVTTYSNVINSRPVHVDPSGNHGTVSSTEDDKENIVDYNDPNDSVLDLQVRIYDRKDGSAVGEVGLIAEEVDALGMRKLVSYEANLSYPLDVALINKLLAVGITDFNTVDVNDYSVEPVITIDYNKPETVLYHKIAVRLLPIVKRLKIEAITARAERDVLKEKVRILEQQMQTVIAEIQAIKNQ